MSFSYGIKEELCKFSLENMRSNESELLSMINGVGNVLTNDTETKITISTENVLLAKKFYELVKTIYNEKLETNIKKGSKKNLYTIIISNKEIIQDIILKLVDIEENIKDIRAYIRGSFIAVGSMSNPEKDYHVEFVCNSIANATRIKEMLQRFDVFPKIIERKNSYIVYMKESDNISTLLNVINAHRHLLKFEEIRVKKDMRNNVNRAVNCETANLNKTICAAIKQLEDIKIIMNTSGIESLSTKLREVAEARLNNPDLSLTELADELGISKSGVNHRLRKISEIAKELRE